MEAPHSIQNDIKVFGRGCVSETSPEYHVLDLLITQSYIAHVLGLFYHNLEKQGHILSLEDPSAKHTTTLDAIIESLTIDQYHEIIEEIQLTAFTGQVWKGHN